MRNPRYAKGEKNKIKKYQGESAASIFAGPTNEQSSPIRVWPWETKVSCFVVLPFHTLSKKKSY